MMLCDGVSCQLSVFAYGRHGEGEQGDMKQCEKSSPLYEYTAAKDNEHLSCARHARAPPRHVTPPAPLRLDRDTTTCG